MFLKAECEDDSTIGYEKFRRIRNVESAGSKSSETSRNSGMSLYNASHRNLNAHPLL